MDGRLASAGRQGNIQESKLGGVMGSLQCKFPADCIAQQLPQRRFTNACYAVRHTLAVPLPPQSGADHKRRKIVTMLTSSLLFVTLTAFWAQLKPARAVAGESLRVALTGFC
jgi:hypothetical protein